MKYADRIINTSSTMSVHITISAPVCVCVNIDISGHH